VGDNCKEKSYKMPRRMVSYSTGRSIVTRVLPYVPLGAEKLGMSEVDPLRC
jgi:hypothetical protein